MRVQSVVGRSVRCYAPGGQATMANDTSFTIHTTLRALLRARSSTSVGLSIRSNSNYVTKTNYYPSAQKK